MKRAVLILIGVLLCASVASAQNTAVPGYKEDTPAVNNENLTMIGVRRCDTTPTSSSGTAADRSELCADANGRLYVNGVMYTSDGTVVSATNPLYVRLTDGTTAVPLSTGGAGASDSNTGRSIEATDSLLFTDPCVGETKTTTPISLTADTVIISATSAKKNYICTLVIVAGAAEIAAITEGTGSTCGTGEAALVGSTTDANGMSFAANGGLSAVGGNSTVIAGKTANVDTCLNVSGSNRVAGWVTWVQK